MAALVRASRSLQAFRILPLSDPRAETLLHPLDAEQRMASMRVRSEGRVLSGGRAAAEVAGALPALGWLPAALDKYGALSRLAEVAYGMVARNRHRLARLVHEVPPVVRWGDE
jgi:predicted DCC family thiol-disulfide oxidoreductase YuxK